MDTAELQSLLKGRGYTTKDVAVTKTQIRLLGSVPEQGAEAASYSVLRSHLLLNFPLTDWTADISRWYFARNGKVWFAHRIILQSDSIETAYPSILKMIREAPLASRVEVLQVPLPGATAARANRSNVGAIGTVVTGPAAATRRGGM